MGVQFDYGARDASFSPDQSSKLPEISTGANYGLNQKEAIQNRKKLEVSRLPSSELQHNINIITSTTNFGDTFNKS